MTCNKESCFRLWKAAKECRESQRQYFKTRETSDLKRAKACEKTLDEEIIHFNRTVNYDGSIPAPIAINQPELFDGREFHHD